MNKTTLDILKKGFPQHLIKRRKGLGGHYDFVTGNSVQDRLDEAFNGDWSWEVDPEFGYKVGKEWICVVGVLTAYQGNGEVLRKSGEGAVQIKKSKQGETLDLGFDLSAASTKALKKAAGRLGVAREIEIAEPDDEGSIPPDVPAQPRQTRSAPTPDVFPEDFDIPKPDRASTNDPGSMATPVQVESINNKVRSTGLNMLEAIRRGLGREDVPDDPKDLTKEEAKSILIAFNRTGR